MKFTEYDPTEYLRDEESREKLIADAEKLGNMDLLDYAIRVTQEAEKRWRK